MMEPRPPTIEYRVRQILETGAGCRHDVDGDRTLADLGVDSMDAIDLMVEIEDQFGIRVEDGSITMDMTVDDLLALISRLCRDQGVS